MVSKKASSIGKVENVELKLEHFVGHLLKHDSLKYLLITVTCFVVVLIISVFILRKLFFSDEPKIAKSQIEKQQKYYQDLLGHIRGLEALRHERELLSKRVMRVIQSWQKKDEHGTAAPGATSEIVDDIADQMRIMKREHLLLQMNCTAALGEKDSAGVFRADPQNQVFQKAFAAAQKDLEKKMQQKSQMELLESDEEEDKEDVRKVEQTMKKRK